MSDKPTNRTRNAITPATVDLVVAIIDGWKDDWEKYSASALERKVASCLRIKCTRQGLLKKDKIQRAHADRLAGKPKKQKQPADVVLLRQRIDRLERRAADNDAMIGRYEELFARIRQNAKEMGIAIDRLERPLAPLVIPDEAKPVRTAKKIA